jgi:predicted N-formylglutamate amidohydrolase
MRLLRPDEPDPVLVLRERGASDYFFVADHAGRLIPGALGDLGLSETDRQRHIAWDIGIQGVTERLSAALDATAVLQRYSRLVIDCNRQPGLPSSIVTISEATRIPGNETLSAEDADTRCREILVPYHARIGALLDARGAVGRRTVLVAMHSFTPVFRGKERPIQIAMLYNRDPRLAHALLDQLRAEGGLTVGDNEPYSVSDETDYSIPVHGERRGLLHVEIEIRQDLIATEAGEQQWADRLIRLLPVAETAAISGGYS